LRPGLEQAGRLRDVELTVREFGAERRPTAVDASTPRAGDARFILARIAVRRLQQEISSPSQGGEHRCRRMSLLLLVVVKAAIVEGAGRQKVRSPPPTKDRNGMYTGPPIEPAGGQESATSSHPICTKIAMPSTGFKVQPPQADGRSKGPIL
jgi:hypothetical protein